MKQGLLSRSSRLLAGSLALIGSLASAGIGQLDTAFGDQGILRLPDSAPGLTQLLDGSLQLVSLVPGNARVLRYTAEGRVDVEFGESGAKPLALPPQSGHITASWPQRDGSVLYRIQERWWSEDPDYSIPLPDVGRLLALRPDGTLDSAFGQSGILAFPVSAVSGSMLSIVMHATVLPDGAIVATVAYFSDYYDCEQEARVYRLDARGAPDRSFGTDGFVSVRDPGCSLFYGSLDVIPVDNDRLLVHATTPFLFDRAGQAMPLPPGFSDTLRRFESTQLHSAVGRFYSVSSNSRSDPHVSVARWNSDLSPDLAYGDSGTGGTRLDFDAIPVGAIASVSAAPLVGGLEPLLYIHRRLSIRQGEQQGLSQIWTTRLSPDGRVDRSWGQDGHHVGWLAEPVLQQADGRLLLAFNSKRVVRLSGLVGNSPGLLSGPACDFPLRVTEDVRSLQIPVSRQFGSAGPATVAYRTASMDLNNAAPASSGVDYVPTSGSLTWADGESGSKSFEIPILDDALPEQDEGFLVVLEPVSGQAPLACDSYRYFIDSSGDRASVVPPTNPGSSSISTQDPTTSGGGRLGYDLLIALLMLLYGRQVKRHR